MSYGLEAIIDYNIPPEQAKAFKVALLWEILSEKEFPNHNHVRLRKSGDPRRSYLFKLCYKLIRDTKGLILDKDYRLYVVAQLQVLKHVAMDAMIDPHILVGERAWRRWKFWKNKYDKNIENYKKTLSEAKPMAICSKVCSSLKKSREFFEKNTGHPPTYEDIQIALKDHAMVRWVTLGRVSPYYILLSPWISKALEGKDWGEVFLFDLSVYQDSITEEVRKYFRQEFSYEFN